MRVVTTKASIVFAACAILLPKNLQVTPETLIVYAPFALTGFLAILAIWPRKYETGAKPERAQQILADYSYEKSVDWIAEANRQSIKANSSAIKWKSYFLTASTISLGVSVAVQIAHGYFIHLS